MFKKRQRNNTTQVLCSDKISKPQLSIKFLFFFPLVPLVLIHCCQYSFCLIPVPLLFFAVSYRNIEQTYMGLPLLSSALWDPSHNCELTFSFNFFIIFYFQLNSTISFNKGSNYNSLSCFNVIFYLQVFPPMWSLYVPIYKLLSHIILV